MGLVRTSAIGMVCAAAALTGAQAADMPGNRPYELPPPTDFRPQAPPTLLSGWYVRGDLGYRWGRVSGSNAAPGFAAPGNEKLGGGFAGGVGLGVKTNVLRTDATIDFGAPQKYEATTFAPNDTTAKVSAITALFNGYLDLGTWYRVTPYIGGGVGAARLRVSDYQSTAAPPFSGDGAHSQWNFAWAAMAGVAYPIAPNMQIDVGYRYLALGNVSTASDAAGQMTLRNIVNHEVRVGLRWNFDDLPKVR